MNLSVNVKGKLAGIGLQLPSMEQLNIYFLGILKAQTSGVHLLTIWQWQGVFDTVQCPLCSSTCTANTVRSDLYVLFTLEVCMSIDWIVFLQKSTAKSPVQSWLALKQGSPRLVDSPGSCSRSMLACIPSDWWSPSTQHDSRVGILTDTIGNISMYPYKD